VAEDPTRIRLPSQDFSSHPTTLKSRFDNASVVPPTMINNLSECIIANALIEESIGPHKFVLSRLLARNAGKGG